MSAPKLNIDELVKKHKPAEPADEAPLDQQARLIVAMEEFANACERKDHVSMARAFRSAFTMLEAQPHEEGPHK